MDMKKTIYYLFVITSLVFLLAGCSLFNKAESGLDGDSGGGGAKTADKTLRTVLPAGVRSEITNQLASAIPSYMKTASNVVFLCINPEALIDFLLGSLTGSTASSECLLAYDVIPVGIDDLNIELGICAGTYTCGAGILYSDGTGEVNIYLGTIEVGANDTEINLGECSLENGMLVAQKFSDYEVTESAFTAPDIDGEYTCKFEDFSTGQTTKESKSLLLLTTNKEIAFVDKDTNDSTFGNYKVIADNMIEIELEKDAQSTYSKCTEVKTKRIIIDFSDNQNYIATGTMSEFVKYEGDYCKYSSQSVSTDAVQDTGSFKCTSYKPTDKTFADLAGGSDDIASVSQNAQDIKININIANAYGWAGTYYNSMSSDDIKNILKSFGISESNPQASVSVSSDNKLTFKLGNISFTEAVQSDYYGMWVSKSGTYSNAAYDVYLYIKADKEIKGKFNFDGSIYLGKDSDLWNVANDSDGYCYLPLITDEKAYAYEVNSYSGEAGTTASAGTTEEVAINSKNFKLDKFISYIYGQCDNVTVPSPLDWFKARKDDVFTAEINIDSAGNKSIKFTDNCSSETLDYNPKDISWDSFSSSNSYGYFYEYGSKLKNPNDWNDYYSYSLSVYDESYNYGTPAYLSLYYYKYDGISYSNSCSFSVYQDTYTSKRCPTTSAAVQDNSKYKSFECELYTYQSYYKYNYSNYSYDSNSSSANFSGDEAQYLFGLSSTPTGNLKAKGKYNKDYGDLIDFQFIDSSGNVIFPTSSRSLAYSYGSWSYYNYDNSYSISAYVYPYSNCSSCYSSRTYSYVTGDVLYFSYYSSFYSYSDNDYISKYYSAYDYCKVE
jgi:hypothetical protein